MIFFWIFLCLPSLNLEANYSSEAGVRQQESLNIFKGAKEGDVPGYQGAPPEVAYNDLGSLESQGSSVQGEHGAFLKDSIAKRPYFEFDPINDPIAIDATKVVLNPQGYLRESEREEKVVKEWEEVTCEESRRDTLYTCTKTLLEPTIHITPAKYSHYWCTSGAHQPDDSRCRAKAYYAIPRKYKDEVVTVTHEQWTSTCGALKEKERLGVCGKIREICPRGPESREVMGTLDSKPVARLLRRECWYYRVEYQCQTPSLNNCEPLRTKGCEQIGSTCIREIAGECVVFNQKFRCPKRITNTKKQNPNPQDLELPNVESHIRYQSNADFADSITKLSVLQEMQQEIRGAGAGSQTLPHVFKGEFGRCRIDIINFNNCCDGLKGWGQSIGFAKCEAEEVALAQRREKNLCHEVGTYCHIEKPIVGCLQERTTFCCFPSKLLRAIQEQGRAQLGIGWGDAKNADCRGLTTEEIARIDFSRLDLREVFQEVMSRQKTHDVGELKRKLSHNVSQMTASLKISGEREAY